MDASFHLFSNLGRNWPIDLFSCPPSLPIQILVITDRVTSHRGPTAEAAAEMRENKLSIFRAKLSLHQHQPSSGLSLASVVGWLGHLPLFRVRSLIVFCNIMSNVFSSPSGPGRLSKLPLPISGVFWFPFQTASVSGLSLQLLFVFVGQAERLTRPETRHPLHGV